MTKKNKKSSNQLDKNIILFFLIVILLSGSAFTYRYIGYEPCNEVLFKATSGKFRAGDVITFKDNTKDSRTRQWDFGDGQTSKRITATNIYDKPGDYKVFLMVNGNCEGYKTITIKEKEFVLDPNKLAKFELPKTIKLGETLKVRATTPNAESWEWNFGETGSYDATTKNAEYKFKGAGLKTVLLIVNGDIRHSTKQKIEVLEPAKPRTPVVVARPRRPRVRPQSNIPDAPPTINDGPPEEKCPPISANSLKSKLTLYSQGKFQLKNFNQYLNGDLNLPVVVNKKTMTFLEFCSKIKGKKIKIKDITVVPGSNDCVKNLTVSYSRSGIW